MRSPLELETALRQANIKYEMLKRSRDGYVAGSKGYGEITDAMVRTTVLQSALLYALGRLDVIPL